MGGSAVQTFSVPTVTEDDLCAFHTKHYSSAQAPSAFFTAPPDLGEQHQNHEQYEEDGYFEEDGLGYYQDGAERTLTDEQIRMFRHSEIQTILRELRIQHENAEYDDRRRSEVDLEVSQTTHTEHEASSPQIEKKASESNGTGNRDSLMTGMKILSAEDRPSTAPPKIPQETSSKEDEESTGSPKRKWDDYIEDSETNPEALTHRRVAREMDQLKPSYLDLMYGEEEAEPPKPIRRKPKARPSATNGSKAV